MRGGLFLMLKKNDLHRLEAHWAVSVIPEKDRQACFHTIDKIKTQKAIKHSIKFNFMPQKDWQENGKNCISIRNGSNREYFSIY